MTKYELSISSDYVKDWTIVEAVREVFQNSLDEERQHSENSCMWSFCDGTLRIGNKNSILRSETLLLGITTKREDSQTIGQFGEGYKLAALVALRTGHPFKIYNQNAGEVWDTKLIKSRRFNNYEIPAFFVRKESREESNAHRFGKMDKNYLIFEIQGITSDEWADIIYNNRHLSRCHDSSAEIHTKFGTIITDIAYQGRIFVSGLFVGEGYNLRYGYDLSPERIKLNRDRDMLDTYDLTRNTALAVASAVLTGDIKLEEYINLLLGTAEGYQDTSSSTLNWYLDSDEIEKLSKLVHDEFCKMFLNKTPVTSEKMKSLLHLNENNSVIVNDYLFALLKVYDGPNPIVKTPDNYYERYKKLLESLEEYMNEDQKKEMDELLSSTRYLLAYSY